MVKGLDVIEAALNDAKQGAMPMKWLIHPKETGDIEIYTDAATTTGMVGFEKKNYG